MHSFILLRKNMFATKALRHKEKNFVFDLLRKKEISREVGKAFLKRQGGKENATHFRNTF
jgi:hypothetical protein